MPGGPCGPCPPLEPFEPLDPFAPLEPLPPRALSTSDTFPFGQCLPAFTTCKSPPFLGTHPCTFPLWPTSFVLAAYAPPPSAAKSAIDATMFEYPGTRKRGVLMAGPSVSPSSQCCRGKRTSAGPSCQCQAALVRVSPRLLPNMKKIRGSH